MPIDVQAMLAGLKNIQTRDNIVSTAIAVTDEVINSVVSFFGNPSVDGGDYTRKRLGLSDDSKVSKKQRRETRNSILVPVAWHFVKMEIPKTFPVVFFGKFAKSKKRAKFQTVKCSSEKEWNRLKAESLQFISSGSDSDDE